MELNVVLMSALLPALTLSTDLAAIWVGITVRLKAAGTICYLEGGISQAASGRAQVTLCGRTRATTQAGSKLQNVEGRAGVPQTVSEVASPVVWRQEAQQMVHNLTRES